METIASSTININITNPRQPYSLSNPSGKPNFTLSQIAAQKTAGARILSEIKLAANNLSISEFIIPAGDYGFAQTVFKNATTNAFMLDSIKRPAENPFVIRAYGVNFWFDIMNSPAPNWGRAVYFNNCENIVLEGLTIDTYVRNTIEGILSDIDVINNRIEITLLDGSFNDESKILAYPSTFASPGSQSRIIPIKPNGNFNVPLYNINDQWGPEYLYINGITKSGTDKYWLNMKSNELLNTIFTPQWLNAYGNDGTLQTGDGICLLYGVMGGVVIDNSKQITIKDTNCYIAKGSIFEGGGYGNHKWINVHFSPRPGTNQILGGGENMSEGLRFGSTYENCYFGITSDDAINMHGFWGIAQSISGNSAVFDRVPSGVIDGDIVEFYDTSNGDLLFSYTINSIVKSLDTDINGNMHNITINFTQAPDVSIVESNSRIWARYTRNECSGWIIRNCVFESNYQRILLQSGSGIFEDNLINAMGSGLSLFANYYSYEGGFINNITIQNNTFLNSSLSPGASPILIEFQNKTTQNQWITNINILNNLFINSGAEAIRLKNAKNIIIEGNIFTNPLEYTAISNPLMQRASTVITGDNVSGLIIKDNLLYEKQSFTNGNKFYNQEENLTGNISYLCPLDTISSNAFEAYSNQKSSQEIINYIISPLETISDSSNLDNLAIVGSPFTENFTKNSIGSLWSYDMKHFSIIENADSIAGKSVKQIFINSTFGGIYAFDTKYKLVKGSTYKLTANYKVLSETMPTGFYFGFTRDGSFNQKNIKVDFSNKSKNIAYTFTREYTLDDFADYYLQWFNLHGSDGTSIVIDTIVLERLSAPTPPIVFNTYQVSGENIISGFSRLTKISDFIHNVTTKDGVIVEFFDKDNNKLALSTFVGTNATIKVSLDGELLASYTSILKADIDGDGNVTIADLTMIKSHILKITALEGIYKNAADIFSKSTISISDLLAVKKLILA